MQAETNREHYAKEILDIACIGNIFAYVKSKGIVSCGKTPCTSCEFAGNCNKKRQEWANSLYLPEPKVEEWIRKWTDMYVADNRVKPVFFNANEPTNDSIITVIVDSDGKAAISPKYKTDSDSASVKNIAIAYARYCGEKIPEEVLNYETD